MIAVLREVKYLETAQNETLERIPESATSMYSRNETFHKFLSNLDLTVAWYNKVRETLLDVEFPLVEGQLQEIDGQLQQAETTLNWNSEGLCLRSTLAPYTVLTYKSTFKKQAPYWGYRTEKNALRGRPP